jgi:hypothetical protein
LLNLSPSIIHASVSNGALILSKYWANRLSSMSIGPYLVLLLPLLGAALLGAFGAPFGSLRRLCDSRLLAFGNFWDGLRGLDNVDWLTMMNW